MTIRQFMRIVEIRTKIVSVSTLLLGFLFAYRVSGSFDPLSAVLLTAAALFVDMATTAFNTFFDYYHRVDRKNTNREKDKVLVHEAVPPAYPLIISLVLYTASAVLGVLLAVMHGWFILALGAASLLVGYLYSGGPFPISRTPLGELFAGGFLGTVLFTIAAATQGLPLEKSVFIASLPSFFHIAAILTVNNTCDIFGDSISGRKTLSILIGTRAAAGVIGIDFLLSYALVFATVPVSPLTAAAAAAGTLMSFSIWVRMIRTGFSHATKMLFMRLVSLSFLVFTAVYAVLLAAA